jgi:hypothetical protein
MACRFAVFVFAAGILWTAASRGQSPAGQPSPDYAPIVLRVACGGVLGTACAKVVPRIAAQTVHAGVVLKLATGGIPFDSATAVCDGQAAAAVVQRDAIALIAHQPTCLNRFDFVGRPLYPYYGFLIARADAPFRDLDELAAGRRRRLIMAGAEGTGGQITLGFLLRSNPAWQRAVTVMMGDPEVGLQKVADGTIDGFFAMEPLDSVTIDRVRRQLDPHGKPLYTFVDIRPGQVFFNIGDGGGHCLYRLTALDVGGAEPVTTVSLDAVMLLGRTSRDVHARGGPRAMDALASAIDAAETAILADTKSPSDWRPPGGTCQ